MIEKIDIENFGSYIDHKHDKNIDSIYKKLNICYGKNYSGKSTFSKIFQAFELGSLPDKYDSVKFSLKLSSGETITEENINNSIKAKVFNSEYIRQKLNFFSDEGINSFALLGDDNIEIEKEINKLEQEKKTLDIKASVINEDFQSTEEQLNLIRNDLAQKKTSLASKIRQDNNLIIGNYDKRNLDRELDAALEKNKLEPEQISEYKQSIIEEEKEIQVKQTFPRENFIELLERTNTLIKKTVKPSDIISELEENQKKQQWVKDGLALHNFGGSCESNCAFCGNLISIDRYDMLNQYFSEEILSFENELKTFLARLEAIKASVKTLKILKKIDFYAKYQSRVELVNESIKIEIKNEISFLDELIIVIERKLKSIFLKIETIDIEVPFGFYSDEENISYEYELIYDANKKLSSRLDSNKKQSRNALRMQFIKIALEQLKYSDLQLNLSQLEVEYNKRRNLYDDIHKLLNKILSEIEGHRAKLSNEKMAAREINNYLNSYLGHEELHLDVSDDQDVQNKFVVLRQDNIAHNLSEGEMSLIAFSYFLASLKKISPSEKADTIIFVDDPISSLDENNIFYIYSLIQSEIINEKYDQVFITTHNLDFLKYATKYKIKSSNKMQLIINKHRKNDGTWGSIIQNMPKYMSSKVTEFNFLFEQIYNVAAEQQQDKNYHVFYNFPNNARKFLETLLFFKYPSYKDPNDDSAWRFKEFFGEGVNEPFINRINNEYSHGLDRFDRLTRQINSAEFEKDAKLILKTIKEKDNKQYQSLLNNSDLSDKEW